MKVREVMSSPVETISEDEMIIHAAEKMKDKNLLHEVIENMRTGTRTLTPAGLRMK